MKDFKDLGLHCGVDEVGRGAWSGPVVAAAVRFDKSHNIRGLADSKTLSPRQRINLYFEILETFSVGVCFSPAKVIDSFNILSSSLYVMQRAVEKVAETKDGNVEVWGDGKQTRSFLFINDCIEATRRLMNSQVFEPINIGSEEMVSINQLVEIVSKIANKKIKINHIDGPLGVRGRNSENSLVREVLNWDYEYSLEDGIKITYEWISKQIIKC